MPTSHSTVPVAGGGDTNFDGGDRSTLFPVPNTYLPTSHLNNFAPVFPLDPFDIDTREGGEEEIAALVEYKYGFFSSGPIDDVPVSSDEDASVHVEVEDASEVQELPGILTVDVADHDAPPPTPVTDLSDPEREDDSGNDSDYVETKRPALKALNPRAGRVRAPKTSSKPAASRARVAKEPENAPPPTAAPPDAESIVANIPSSIGPVRTASPKKRADPYSRPAKKGNQRKASSAKPSKSTSSALRRKTSKAPAAEPRPENAIAEAIKNGATVPANMQRFGESRKYLFLLGCTVDEDDSGNVTRVYCPFGAAGDESCSLAGGWTRSLGDMTRHINTHYDETKSAVRCHLCGDRLSRADALKRHLAVGDDPTRECKGKKPQEVPAA